MKESNGSFEEVCGEGKEENGVVKVLDGEDEKELIVKRIEREEGSQEQNECVKLSVSILSTEMDNLNREEGSQESNEAVDDNNSVMAIIDSEGSDVTDGVSVSSEELLLEDLKEDQLSVSVARTEIEDSSRSIVNIENDAVYGEVLDQKCDNEEVFSVKSDFDTAEEQQVMESGLKTVHGDSSEKSYPIIDKDAENDSFQEFGEEDMTETLPMVRYNHFLLYYSLNHVYHISTLEFSCSMFLD